MACRLYRFEPLSARASKKKKRKMSLANLLSDAGHTYPQVAPTATRVTVKRLADKAMHHRLQG